MPKSNQPRRTWKYPEEFKAKAVQLSLMNGVQVKAVADKRKKVVSLAKDKEELKHSKSGTVYCFNPAFR